MTRPVIVRSSPPVQRRHRVGEMAGGTAAECAAVCCCCPCAAVHFVVLALYTVPKGLLKRRKRQRLLRETANQNDVVPLHQQKHRSSTTGSGTNDNVVEVGPTLLKEHLAKEPTEGAVEKSEAVVLEKEMWARFAGTGFWRSESQRQP